MNRLADLCFSGDSFTCLILLVALPCNVLTEDGERNGLNPNPKTISMVVLNKSW